MNKRGKKQIVSGPVNIVVAGTNFPISKNDSLAKFIDENQHLIPWNERDKNRLIDRYDARNFFDVESSFVYEKKKRKTSIPTDMEDKILNEERFYDLFHQNEIEIEDSSSKEEIKKVDKKPTEKKGVFRAVGFQYESPKEEAPKIETEPEIPFSPPFPVPSSIKVPSQKIHEIIFRTADFILKQGPNAELILKLKQSNNPNFSFLENGSEFYPYYNYLKQKYSSIHQFLELKVPENKQLDILLNESISEPQVSTSNSPILSESKESFTKLVDYESEEENQEPLIEPPADVKQVMEKVVLFVKKAGKSFESEIRKREAFNPRFQFLNPLHMYHPYYLQLLSPTPPNEKKLTEPETPKKRELDESQKKEIRLKKAKLMMEMIKDK